MIDVSAAADALWCAALLAGFSAVMIKQNTSYMCYSNLLP